MKKETISLSRGQKVGYWAATGFIFLFEGVMPALTGHSELARNSILHLGYPEYFVTVLVLFKVTGALALLIPKIPARIKEWAYAGFTIELLCASASNWIVDGFGFAVILPLIILAILISSYIGFHAVNPEAA